MQLLPSRSGRDKIVAHGAIERVPALRTIERHRCDAAFDPVTQRCQVHGAGYLSLPNERMR